MSLPQQNGPQNPPGTPDQNPPNSGNNPAAPRHSDPEIELPTHRPNTDQPDARPAVGPRNAPHEIELPTHTPGAELPNGGSRPGFTEPGNGGRNFR